MKAVPNWISFCRIILSLGLVFVKPLGVSFYIIYVISGFSDMIDGIIARKTGTTSRLGEKLDSLADIIMLGVLFVVLYPIVNPSKEIIIWIISIGIARLAAMVVALKKYKTFAILHTFGNKITGMALFIFPILLLYIHADVLMHIICIIASISLAEELIIELTSSRQKKYVHQGIKGE